jgi:hypothetical protein
MPEIPIVKAKRDIAPFVFFAISLLFSFPFLIRWNYIGVGDWELFTTMAAVPVRTILLYHQFPFWNPYIGGGNILFAHPETAILSPFSFINLLFGPMGGLKLQIFVCYFLGFWGSYLFARKLGFSKISSYLISFVYYGSSYFGLHFSIGHIPFTHFCFLPWFLFFLLKSGENWKYLLAGGLSIALLILGNGAAVPFLYTVFFSGLFICLYSLETRTLYYIKGFIFATVAGVLAAAIKFIPMFSYLSGNRWEGMAGDVTPLDIALKGFFSIDQWIFRSVGNNQYWGWHEYSAYLSPLVVILALVGIIFAFRKSRIWLVIAVFFLLFGLGNFSAISPWNLFTKIPGFSSIRSPARAFQFVLLASGIMAGFGIDYLIDKWKNSFRQIKISAGIVAGIILLVNFIIILPNLNTAAYLHPEPVAFDSDFKQEIGQKQGIYQRFLQNRGSLIAPWLSGYKESRGLVTPVNDVLMEYSPDGQFQLISRNYTPNRVEYEILPSQAGTLIFGIGYDEGWRAVDGREVSENNGLVSVNYNLNDRKIVLYYRPPYFWSGLIISIISIGLGLLLLFYGKAGKRLETVFK